MAVTIRKGAHVSRGEVFYDSANNATDANVDVIEFSSGGLTSVVRKLPSWEDTITIGFRLGISAAALTGNLTNAEWFFGLCPGPTYKYGAAAEYCIGNGNGTKARTLTQLTFASSAPTNYAYQLNGERICLWDSGSASVIGSNQYWNITNPQAVWSLSAVYAAYSSKPWETYVFNFRRSAADKIYVRWSTQLYPNNIISADEFRKGVTDFSSDLTSTAFDSREPWCILTSRAFSATDILTCQGELTVDESLYGPFEYFNMAWNQAGQNLLVRDIWVSAKYPQFYT